MSNAQRNNGIRFFFLKKDAGAWFFVDEPNSPLFKNPTYARVKYDIKGQYLLLPALLNSRTDL